MTAAEHEQQDPGSKATIETPTYSTPEDPATGTGQQNEEQEVEDQSPKTCPLLLLPAELRLQIYAWALHPTSTLTLTTTPTKRHSVVPKISPSLLSTCRQIAHECNPLLYSENEVFLTIDAHDTCWPAISESRLPQHVLEKLERLFVILDCTSTFWASYEDVDFTAFTALVSLKKIRVAVLYNERDEDEEEGSIKGPRDCEILLEQILSRIPKDTEVLRGYEIGSPQDERVQELLASKIEKNQEFFRNARVGNRLGGMQLTGLQPPERVIAMAKEDVAEMMGRVPHDLRGCKSGKVEDVFAEYRTGQGWESTVRS